MPNWAEASTQRSGIRLFLYSSFLFPSVEMRSQNIESLILDSRAWF